MELLFGGSLELSTERKALTKLHASAYSLVLSRRDAETRYACILHSTSMRLDLQRATFISVPFLLPVLIVCHREEARIKQLLHPGSLRLFLDPEQRVAK